MPEVPVYFLQGRTLDQKRALVREITDVVARNFDVAPEAVMIQTIENSKRLGGKRRSPVRRSFH